MLEVDNFAETLEGVEELLGYGFKDRAILLRALCHRSYVYENGLSPADSNERLEFLGDSVVELSASHMLFEDFPDFAEGELTKVRAPMVKRQTLARVAGDMGLGRFILLGKGEESTGGREKESILADTFEAVVGAVYLDGGFAIARGLVMSCLESVKNEIIRLGTGDYKSELQELAARNTGSLPRYSLSEEGPDHFKTFHATVSLGDRVFGPVSGASKKEAEQGAARAALDKLGWHEEEGLL